MNDSNLGFGITKDTRSEGVLLFPTPSKFDKEDDNYQTLIKQFPNGYKFPIGRLVNVVANPKYETKNGESSVVQFIFRGREGEQHTHIIFEQDPTDSKYKENVDKYNGQIKHIMEQTQLKLPESGLGTGAKSWDEYFKIIADFFNEQLVEVDNKKVKKYSMNKVYLKLTYYKGRLNFPLFPNFIQAAEIDGKPQKCKLAIDIKYDKLDPSNSNDNTNFGGSPDTTADDLPNFDNFS